MSNPTPAPATTTDTDPNPYIRTYAKDFAKLSGTPLSQKPVADLTQSSATPTDGQMRTPALITGELSSTEKEMDARDARAAIAEKEIAQELSSVPATTASLQAPPQETSVGRESILNRLRARAQTNHTTAQLPQMEPIAPVPAVDRTKDLPTPPLAPVPPSVPMPPPIPQRSATPAPPPSHTPEPQAAASPFHSYKTDFADRIDEKQATAFSVLAAEDSTPAPLPEKPKKQSAILPILIGVILIICAGTGSYFAYLYMREHAPVPLTPTLSSLISPDEKLALSSTDPRAAFLQAVNQPLPQGSVEVTYIIESTTTSKGQVEQVPESGGALLSALQLPAPDILLRNIDPSSTVGIVHAGSETRPFFLLHVTSYDRTFSGMLSWEPTMANDLTEFYPLYTTASDTPGVAQNQFVDSQVNSHSVRELLDTNGQVLMLYGYTADQQTLIIARDPDAFTLLVNRLSANGS